MINTDFWNENGFIRLKNGLYVKKLYEIIIFAEINEDSIVFRCDCGSSTVDFEDEVTRFIINEAAQADGVDGFLSERRMEIVCRPQGNGNETELAEKAIKIISDAREKYGLIPACTKCKRLAPVDVYIQGSKGGTICGICKDEKVLYDKHEKIKEKYQAKGEKNKNPDLEWKPIKYCFMIGIGFGILSAVIYSIMLIISTVIPQVGLFPWIPSAIAGYNVMRRIIKVDYNSLFARFMSATAGTFISTLAFCIIGFIVVYSIIMGTGQILISFATIMAVIMWLTGYFFAAAVAYFSDQSI